MSTETLADILRTLKPGDETDVTRYCYGMDSSYVSKVARGIKLKIRTRCKDGIFYARLA